MTSIAHPVLPGAVPAVGGSSTPSESFERRLFQPAGSKAVRLGLGVAIAAVMAGDVYAVLRSPVSEGRGAGSSAAASAAGLEDGSGPAVRFADTAGHVAMNPFSDAAYGASLGSGSAGGPVIARAAAPAVTAAPAATTALPGAPVAAPAATIVLPSMPAAPAFTPPQQTTESDAPPPPPPPPPPAPAQPSVLDPVVDTVNDVPVVGQPVAQAITTVAEQIPTEQVVTAVPEPVKAPLGL